MEHIRKKASFFENKILQYVVRFLTALSFALFTGYQFILLIAVNESKTGRLLGIISFLLITVGSFFSLGNKKAFLLLHMILLIGGLMMVFIIKLFNIPTVFGDLNFTVLPSVLCCLVYLFAQLGAILLAVYFLAIRNKKENRVERKLTYIMMSIVIVLFVAAFVMECIMLIKYRINIDLKNLKVTLLSRAAYCFGFVGTAIGFMLPAPFIDDDDEYKKKQGDFVYSEDVEDEIDLIM